MTIALKRWLKAAILTILLVCLFLGLDFTQSSKSATANAATLATMPTLISALPPGNAITDGKALLRYALPIDNEPVRTIQRTLEDTSNDLRARRRFGAVNGSLTKVERILNGRRDKLLAPVPDDRKPKAEAIVEQLKTGIGEMRAGIEAQDRELLWAKRSELLDLVGQLEELMVTKFPFDVPEEYSDLPQLKGRATIEFVTNKGTMTAVVDGYSAPITAGNFVDLVQRGFYDGMEFTRAEDNYVLQIGDPPGPETGFVDPTTGTTRVIPFEVLVEGDSEPTYGTTLEAAGRYLDKPVLPFSAFGALGMARPESDVNAGSSQFFFFLFEPELTPAGLNLLDGRFAVFGYVAENKELLEQLKQGDKIESARVIDGAEHLVNPSQSA